MSNKILRDIEKKGSETIFLEERTESHRGEIPLKSTKQNIKFKATNTEKLIDIHPKEETTRNEPKKVLFFHVNKNEKDNIGDVIRIFAGGLLILFVLNIVNVYKNGIELKDSVIASATTGYQELLQAGSEATNMDFGTAEMTFNQATKSFQEAEDAIAYLNTNEDLLFTKEKTIDSVQNLLNAAENVSKAGENFVKGIKNMQNLPELFIQANSSVNDSVQKSLTDKLKEDLSDVETAIDYLKQAEENLEEVSPSVLPKSLKERLNYAKSTLTKLNQILENTKQKIPAFLTLLGDRYPHRYLVLLQNDTEVRPTGGFIGSYMIIDINDGIITKMDFHDIYELDGQLQEYIEPPEDIAAVTNNWRMRDSNYSPDFTISAAKAAWFLQKQKGPSVDTVIAVNQSFMASLLELTGPIQLESLQKPLDKSNYQLVLSFIIESKLSGVENPKEILGELIPAFQSKLLTNASLEDIFKTFLQGFSDKKLFIFSRNENVQKVLDEFNISGRIPLTNPKEDYLNVIATSIGGNKSDRYINQSIKHNTLIKKDGTIRNEVIIKRRHTWTGASFEEIRKMLAEFGYNDLPDQVASILGAGTNKAYIKVYVPEGSILVDAEGIVIEDLKTRYDEEIQKSYFMFVMEVNPDAEKTVSITYELPTKLNLMLADSYRLFAINQPGFAASYFEKRLLFDPGLKIYRTYPTAFYANIEQGGLVEYTGVFDGNLYLSALVGR
jgi:hypothetical protein